MEKARKSFTMEGACARIKMCIFFKNYLLSHKVSEGAQEATSRAVGNCYTIK